MKTKMKIKTVKRKKEKKGTKKAPMLARFRFLGEKEEDNGKN